MGKYYSCTRITRLLLWSVRLVVLNVPHLTGTRLLVIYMSTKSWFQSHGKGAMALQQAYYAYLQTLCSRLFELEFVSGDTSMTIRTSGILQKIGMTKKLVICQRHFVPRQSNKKQKSSFHEILHVHTHGVYLNAHRGKENKSKMVVKKRSHTPIIHTWIYPGGTWLQSAAAAVESSTRGVSIRSN